MADLIDCGVEDARWQGLEAQAQTSCLAALARLNVADAGFEISLLGCDDARIAELNAEFRDKPTPTNVLSWPSEERAAVRDGDMPVLPDPNDPMQAELGDIAIAYETCAREALSLIHI